MAEKELWIGVDETNGLFNNGAWREKIVKFTKDHGFKPAKIVLPGPIKIYGIPIEFNE